MAELKKPVQAFVIDTGGDVHRMISPVLASLPMEVAKHHAVVEKATAGGESQVLKDEYGTPIGGVDCARRPVNFALFAYAATVDTYHKVSLRTKVLDVIGRKWSINGEGSQAKKDRITDFFRNAFGKRTFAQGMGCVWTDYEALGNGYLEVVPDKKGEPVELVHVPATEMWIRLDELGYVQQKNGKYAHFRDFAIDLKKYSDLTLNDPLKDELTHPVIHWSQYSPWSSFYGLPPIMPAWNAITVRALIAEFNLNFFANNAIPDYAVIVEGEASEATVEVLKEYFRSHLKGKNHKTLIMDTPDGQKIRFEKLTSDNTKEGSFRLLRQDCRDEILHAHQMQPNKIGIHTAGSLGDGRGQSQERVYKETVVDPGREAITDRLNKIIQIGFGEPALSFEFEPYDIDDEEQSTRMYEAEYRSGVITANEWRQDVYPDREPLEGGDEPMRQPSMSDLAGFEDAFGSLQNSIEKAVAK